jgi:hypothetical protein
MTHDAQSLMPGARTPTKTPAAAAPRGPATRVRRPVRAAVRRRFDEARLAAAVRELRTHRHPRLPA